MPIKIWYCLPIASRIAFVRVDGILGRVMSQYTLIKRIGLILSLCQMAVWQSLSERCGSCQISSDGLCTMAALGFNEDDRHVKGGGIPKQVPAFIEGSCIRAILLFSIKVSFKKVCIEGRLLCAFSW